MADRRPSPRAAAALGAGLLLVVVLTVVRGPVALAALGTAAVVVTVLAAAVPLQRPDGVDWDWLPGRAAEVPPEPGIATLRLLLDPSSGDTTAPERLQALVRAIAEDHPGGPIDPAGGTAGTGALARYLSGPPRPLPLDEVEAVVADLESLSASKETP